MTDDFQEEIDELIRSINATHLYEKRLVRGKDLNDHHQQLVEWETDRRYDECLQLLEEIIACTHTLVQYDTREPQAYWPMKAVSIYLRTQRPDQAVIVLQQWLDAWPPERGEHPDRVRVRRRLNRLLNRTLGQSGDNQAQK